MKNIENIIKLLEEHTNKKVILKEEDFFQPRKVNQREKDLQYIIKVLKQNVESIANNTKLIIQDLQNIFEFLKKKKTSIRSLNIEEVNSGFYIDLFFDVLDDYDIMDLSDEINGIITTDFISSTDTADRITLKISLTNPD